MAGMILGGIMGGVGGYQDARRGSREWENWKAMQEAAAGPQTTTRTPWDPVAGMIEEALGAAQSQFQGGGTRDALRNIRGIPGASPKTRELLGEIEDRARNPSETLQSANQFVQDRLGGSMNPVTQDLYGRLGGASFDRGGDLLMDFLGGGGGAGFDPWSGRDVLEGAAPPSSPGATPVTPRFPAGGGGVRNVSARRPAPGGGAGASAGDDGMKSWLKQHGIQRQPGAAPLQMSWEDRKAGRRNPPVQATGTPPGGNQPAPRRPDGGPPAPAPAPIRPQAPPATEIPDSMGTDSFFSDQVRQLFDPSRLDPANDPTMAPYIDALRTDMEDALSRQRADLNDQFTGLNSFNSSARALAQGEAGGQFDRALASELARTYMGAREANLGRQMEALGMVSGRDLSAMGDRTQRYGIDTAAETSRRNAASASAASRAAQDAQIAFQREQLAQQGELANRGMNLDAIQSLIGMDQFGLGLMGGLGEQVDAGQFAALGAVPGLEGIPMDYYGMAMGGRGAADALNQSAGANRQALDIQRALGPQADLNRYLSQLMGPGTAFGTTVSEGTPPTGLRDPSPNPWISGLLGGIGGVMSGAGAFGGG